MNFNNLRNWIFYTLKPLIPRPVQIYLRRQIARHMRRKNGYLWPIDPNAAKPPEGWPGWPDGKKFALVLSHDVDTVKGYNVVSKLADIEQELGFRSSFNFVPERYGTVDVGLLNMLKSRGFGIGVHGLKHDGRLFRSKKIFDERAPKINAYLKKWGTRGFTTPSMIRNHDWMHALDLDYCVSTFDTDPFEPEPDAVGTIFPFAVFRKAAGPASQLPSFFIELPYTLPQDSTLFLILQEKTIDIWIRKLGWVAEKGGMVLLNAHSDYMNFDGTQLSREEYPVAFYIEFLKHVKSVYAGKFFNATFSEIAAYFRQTCLHCSHAPGVFIH